MQNKPQMVEAVVFFNDRGICKEMLFPEFEAVLDGVVNLQEFADRQMRAVFLLITPRLLIRAAVFFCIDFHEDGAADRGWNIPLRQLADRTGRGPDLGAGPIRLACRSQCPVSWQQMHLWDPRLKDADNELTQLRDRIARNQLGLLIEEEVVPPVATERLQMVAEDAWYAGRQARPAEATLADQEQRQKAALLIKQQRQRIANLERQREEEGARLREAASAQQEQLHEQLRELQRKLQEQQALNASLHAQLAAEVEHFQKARDEMGAQLRALELNGQQEASALREHSERETESRVAAAVAELKEQVAIRDVELAYRNELDAQLEEEIARLTRERDELAAQAEGMLLVEKLAQQGVAFTAYHPGIGHLTLSLQDIQRYHENPTAFVAARCNVPEEQYRQWLQHYQQPACVAALSSGERCAIPLDKIDSPSRFVIGVSNCCARHKVAEQRTGS
ncbi:chromosome partitioning protein ParA [Pseudomonas oligotrophica]|uniref:chromosome partitioning protein ParA n=1 Tax=Pseudomonas oligotrophica TaxID=2912055 RepID=UPI001F4018F5|nr:chromosome partitioning protein ParA [Pseudomonas oligotrophica]MCF7202947.1 chromosome partitioning protein ParA [Pseudomonas oligotrophica]